MTDKDVRKLKRLKQRQIETAEAIGKMKESAPAEFIEKLETAEREAWNTVIDLDAVANQITKPLADQIERETFLLSRHFKPKRPRMKIGGIWV